MKVIGIVGTRKRDKLEDYKIVRNKFLKVFEEGDVICSGLCSQGADRFAVSLADFYDTPRIWFPADWKRQGKAAGFIRNTYIAKLSNVLIACVATDRKGGTEDTIEKYLRFHKKNFSLYIV